MGGLLEVVSQWLSGRKVDDNLVVLGLEMIWWGRIGKVLAFLGGGTIILDIIGPERVTEWSKARRAVAPRTRRAVHHLVVSLAFLVIALVVPPLIMRNDLPALQLTVVVAVAVVALMSFAGRAVADGVARLLRKGAGATVLRLCAAILLSVGFLLDLASS